MYLQNQNNQTPGSSFNSFLQESFSFPPCTFIFIYLRTKKTLPRENLHASYPLLNSTLVSSPRVIQRTKHTCFISLNHLIHLTFSIQQPQAPLEEYILSFWDWCSYFSFSWSLPSSKLPRNTVSIRCQELPPLKSSRFLMAALSSRYHSSQKLSQGTTSRISSCFAASASTIQARCIKTLWHVFFSCCLHCPPNTFLLHTVSVGNLRARMYDSSMSTNALAHNYKSVRAIKMLTNNLLNSTFRIFLPGVRNVRGETEPFSMFSWESQRQLDWQLSNYQHQVSWVSSFIFSKQLAGGHKDGLFFYDKANENPNLHSHGF